MAAVNSCHCARNGGSGCDSSSYPLTWQSHPQRMHSASQSSPLYQGHPHLRQGMFGLHAMLPVVIFNGRL